MKRYLFLLLLMPISVQSQENPQDRIGALLDSLSLRVETIGNVQKSVFAAYEFVMPRINSGEIALSFDSTFNYGLGGCAAASFINEKKMALVMGDYILDLHDAFPLLAEAIVMHEFQHLYDGLTKPEMFVTKDNPIEEAYYEVDGIYIEALFIRYYRTPSDKRTTFDKYLDYDLDYGLESIALIATNCDLSFLHYIDEIRLRSGSQEEALKLLIDQGDSLLLDLDRTGDNWTDFQLGIRAHTYINKSRQLLRDVLYQFTDKQIKDKKITLEKYPEYYAIVQKLIEKMTEEGYYGSPGFLVEYSEGLFTQFEAELPQRQE